MTTVQRARLDALVAWLHNLDPRITASIVTPWKYPVCQLCAYLECRGCVSVQWVSAYRGDQQAEVGIEHVEGWVPGLLLPDCAPEHGVLIEIGDDA